MSRTYSGFYEVKNPEKYIGNKKPFMRSSWERKFAEMCDGHPNIIHWASEHDKTRIPYLNPLTGKHTIYVPDFFVVYKDKNGKKRVELVEVKPANQTYLAEAKSKRDKAALAVNAAKWAAAQEWCKRKGIAFRVITEYDIFKNPSKK